MNASFLLPLFPAILALLWFPAHPVAYLSAGEDDSAEPLGESNDEAQVASGIPLPHWGEGEGECRESFDVRIWPGAVVIWLEQQNLRTRIADPATTDSERQSLKRILALQQAWRNRVTPIELP